MLKQMVKSIALVSLFVSSAAFAEGAHHWNYEGDTAPEKWGELSPEFKLCSTGKYQSPIDIQRAYKTDLPDLKVHYQIAPEDVVNNGHTIQVSLKEKEQNYLILDGEKYYLQQFHFHTPSENLIEGKSYPLEAHFVHADSKGDIAVLAVMFEVGDENKALDGIWGFLSKEENKTADLSKPIDVSKLVPKGDEYYRFSGSLTTPPCSEGVAWLVTKVPSTISKAQLAKFQEALHAHNNRPVQPLNGRIIIKD